ncbi:MAG TPA: PIN domain-containing protein [Dehalococcoidia bacterium]|nr:PIN domain-containing protein [Dehalococcoidia bacterium]
MTVPSIYFIDSNVLVYAIDPTDKAKQRMAITLLDTVARLNVGAISAQVLGETFNTITRKIDEPVDPRRAADELLALSRVLTVYPITGQTVRRAFTGVLNYQMSYWDALIWATAKLNGIATILTEDIQSGGAIEGVSFLNPFTAGFDAASLA